ncbi:MAG: hypothetical protein U0Y68_27320 [Blastocatellia bacterium]
MRFVLSVASRHVQDRLERQRNRSLRLDTPEADFPFPAEASASSLPHERQRDEAA